ncbi:hypothetical protein ONS96_012249 [Cadophora gregata f. sp. sojae]|nr:hypothetical protein ONS96_012249 [Cadophora gregata f. sp. sojae]
MTLCGRKEVTSIRTPRHIGQILSTIAKRDNMPTFVFFTNQALCGDIYWMPSAEITLKISPRGSISQTAIQFPDSDLLG